MIHQHTNENILSSVHIKRSGDSLTIKFRTATITLTKTGAVDLAHAILEIIPLETSRQTR
jgi:hypothetical protein